ncbi:MAG: alpha/beta hydrolase [Gloeocapsa sp. UFS-A4-WI-NPMV-4B04]|nr:alpha/beta hydrolase [Gloeocapsa sp. UFS-A4-WI-NPMV-4B04]
MLLLFLSLRRALVLMATASILLFSTSAIAADQVVLKYRIFRESISVEELSAFAETGELSKSLRINLALARQDPKAVRRYLTQPVKINVVLLDRLLNSPVGNLILNEVTEVVHTPSGKADRQALRSALVISASRDSNISLIEIIQNYPTQVVQVEGDRLESAYRQLRRLEGRLQDLVGG